MAKDDDDQLQHDTEQFERAFERQPRLRSREPAEEPDESDEQEGEEDEPEEHHPAQRERDEHGRFRKRDDGDEGEDEGEGEGGEEDDQEQQRSEAIPAWRLREVAEERRQLREQMAAIQRERDAYAARVAAYERQQRELQRQQQRPDFISDPAGYHQWVEQERQRMREEFRGEMRNARINETFEAIREQEPERFQRAWATLCRAGEQGDPIFERVRNAQQPGRALMRWFGDLEVLHEIGGDINSFRQKEADRLMADPEFRKAAMEQWRDQANGDGRGERSSGGPRNLPSIHRMTGSNRPLEDRDDDQGDDEDKFNRAFDPRPTRRRRAG